MGGLTLSPITNNAELYIFQLCISHVLQSHLSITSPSTIFICFYLALNNNNKSILIDESQLYHLVIYFLIVVVSRGHFESIESFCLTFLFRDAYSFFTFGLSLSLKTKGINKKIFRSLFFQRIIYLTKL